jgi:hypothetical protein
MIQLKTSWIHLTAHGRASKACFMRLQWHEFKFLNLFSLSQVVIGPRFHLSQQREGGCYQNITIYILMLFSTKITKLAFKTSLPP